METCILAVGFSWKTFRSGDLQRGSCDVGEGWSTRSGPRCFAVPSFPILPAMCGDAQAAFVLQFVGVKTANQLRRAITGVVLRASLQEKEVKTYSTWCARFGEDSLA